MEQVTKAPQIAVVVDAVTQFNAIKHALDGLSKKALAYDLIIPAHEGASKAILDDAFRFAQEQGFAPVREPRGEHTYQILLEPYRTDHFFTQNPLTCVYRIRYSYGLVCTKPTPCLHPEYNLKHDALICHSKIQAEYHSAYLKSHLVGFPRYYGFKKQPHQNAKPNLLYLPTFGDVSSVKLIKEALPVLKQQYNVMIKTHHAIEYRQEEQASLRIIKEGADEFFASTTPVEELLAKADIVLSDNSGAIFDAIYTQTPVAIFSDAAVMQDFGCIEPIQRKLIEQGIIPFTDKADDLLATLNKATELLEAQSQLREDFLTEDTWENLVGGFVSVIEGYLTKDRPSDYYCQTHDQLRQEFFLGQAAVLREEGTQWRITQLEAENRGQSDYIAYVRNSLSWKLTKPLRAIRRLFKKDVTGQ